jgi:F0F1-type ATP synthase alpha subunit
MSLSPTHSRASKKNRKMIDNGKPIQNVMKQELQYNKSDALVEKCYVDIANGASRSDVIQKLCDGIYTDFKYSRRQAQNYYNAALDRFAIDTDIEAEKLRNVFYGRYESLLNDAIEKGDIYNARGILDSMARIFGVEKKMPQNAIQIQGGDEKIVINFGLDESNVQD